LPETAGRAQSVCTELDRAEQGHVGRVRRAATDECEDRVASVAGAETRVPAEKCHDHRGGRSPQVGQAKHHRLCCLHE